MKTNLIVKCLYPAVFLLLFSCSKEELPTACFTSQVTSTKIQFNSSCSQNASEYFWDFGNGKNSIDPNPVHDYGTVGTFNVTLKVSNSDGSNTVTKSVKIPKICRRCTCYEDTPLGPEPTWEENFCGTAGQLNSWENGIRGLCSGSLDCYDY